MKYYGDIPEDHVDRAMELEMLEEWFNKQSVHGPDKIAKGLTCIAHDYYYIEFDEEGSRLLQAAERRCPGYFKSTINDQMIEDAEFSQLVLHLTRTLAIEVMASLGFDP